MAILLHDVTYPWGVLMAVGQTKTICFGERVLSVPFNKTQNFISCVDRYIRLLLMLVRHPSKVS